jgi:hypothetical protein
MREIDAEFPSITIHSDRVLYRIHREVKDPVEFTSHTGGRFNLRTVAGVGTCYMASSPLGAYIEVFGRFGTFGYQDLAERSMSELALSRPVRLADLTSREILGRYGIAGEMSAGTDYVPCQQLASALYDNGFDGIFYTARHDPSFAERSVAVFGGSGEVKLFATDTYAIPEELVREAEMYFALRALPDLS